MNYDQDLAIYIPEGDFTSFHGLPTPPTEPSSSNQSQSDPPTHKTLTPLDRVGVSSNPIGPRRRQRRCTRTPQQQARSVARRNARERKRVKLVNLGFATLRDHIPPHMGLNTAPAQPATQNKGKASNNKKLSKVETLRCAIEYIRQLREAVGYDDRDMDVFDDKGLFDDKDLYDDKGGSGGSVEGFSPAETSSSCTSPVAMLTSPSLFDDEDENDDFFNIVDWTTL